MRGEIRIDGSMGEGGGQVLRTSLTLSALTGRPLHLVNIRAGREKPGLRPQHLQAVAAAAAITGAEMEGATLASQELHFRPAGIRAGNYRFDIGTAGATSLVLQTVYLPLACAGGESRVAISGGTHVPLSPAFDYLHRQWLPFIRRVGLELDLELALAGFYPAGGGLLQALIRPAAKLRPLKLLDRGRLVRLRCLSRVSNLPLAIAERQSCRARTRLASYASVLEVENSSMPARGKGTLLFLHAEFERTSASYFALGERSKPAEKVADEAVDPLLRFFDSDGAIDEYLADQIVLPLALTEGESIVRTPLVTRHLITNVEVISSFVPITVDIDGALGRPGTIRIRGIPLPEIRSGAE